MATGLSALVTNVYASRRNGETQLDVALGVTDYWKQLQRSCRSAAKVARTAEDLASARVRTCARRSLLNQRRLQCDRLPLTALLHVHAGESIIAAVVLPILTAFLVRPPDDDGGVSINADGQVGDRSRIVMKRAGLEPLDDLVLRAQLAAQRDERVVGGGKPVERGSVAAHHGVVALVFNAHDLLLDRGLRLNGLPALRGDHDGNDHDSDNRNNEGLHLRSPRSGCGRPEVREVNRMVGWFD